jgi:RNA polymerase sigma-70 factor, ECF subfamily
LPDETRLELFERTISPHLSAAYNLARWLIRNEHDAEDVVQEAFVRAFSAFHGFRGGDGRPWLLAIVRNTCFTWMKRNKTSLEAVEFNEATHSNRDYGTNPEELAQRAADRRRVRDAVESLAVEYREAIVLREMEGLSYKEIADIARVPLGTVMSRLARARNLLRERLGEKAAGQV